MWFEVSGGGWSLQIDFHLAVDQAAADAEDPVAEDRGSRAGGIEETSGDGFELGVAEFVLGGRGGVRSAHGSNWFGWLVWFGLKCGASADVDGLGVDGEK